MAPATLSTLQGTLLDVYKYLNIKSLHALTLTSKSLYPLANQALYQHDAKYGHGYALLWASVRGNWPIAHFSLLMGANINTQTTAEDAESLKLRELYTPQVLTLDSEKHQRVYTDKYWANALELAEKYKSGQSPLHLAISAGHCTMVKMLLSIPNVDVNLADAMGKTPLHIAAAYGNLDVVMMLTRNWRLNHNALERRGRSALHLAVCEQHAAVVTRILDEGRMNNDAPDALQLTPLVIASFLGNVEITKDIASSFDVEIPRLVETGSTLYRALEWNMTRLTQNATQTGQVVIDYPMMCFPCRNTDDGTMRPRILCYGCPRINGVINICEANVNTKINPRHDTILHQAILRDDAYLIQVLLTNPHIDVNCINIDGCTPLMLATKMNRVAIAAEVLAKPYVDLDVMDKYGETAYLHAVEKGYMEIADMIISYWRVAANVRQEAVFDYMYEDSDSEDEDEGFFEAESTTTEDAPTEDLPEDDVEMQFA
ncbi:Alpha-latrotoxin-Lh1a-like protein [Cladobotryum mycophilum]|uniref:Alpha-latrotoxin-Lh1a-like protein n=1 Tax=Cladobotryum mycophilum TaxID=491253 RepID=A0ABR0T3F2_9HYPO